MSGKKRERDSSRQEADFGGTEKKQRAQSVPLSLKTCTKCWLKKPRHEFGSNQRSTDGKAWNCRMCERQRGVMRAANKSAAYRQEQKEKKDAIFALTEEGLQRCVECEQTKARKEFHWCEKPKNTKNCRCRQCCNLRSKVVREHHTANFVPEIDDDTVAKRCARCKQTKTRKDFHRSPGKIDGRMAFCRLCANESKVKFRQSMHGFLSFALAHMKGASSKRHERGRLQDEVMEYDMNMMCTQLTLQNHCCAISGLPLAFSSFSDWMMSPDRIDDDADYTTRNVRFICHEFNIRQKWSTQSLGQMAILANSASNSKFFLTDSMRKHINNQRLAAKTRTLVKNKRTPHKLTFALTLPYLLQLLEEQSGCCFYSGVRILPPLVTASELEKLRQLSLERLDPLKGYETGNVAFICLGFQGPDQSRMQNRRSPATGSGGWSKTKVAYLLRWMEEQGRGLPKPSVSWSQFQAGADPSRPP